jgi:hypothetical protein
MGILDDIWNALTGGGAQTADAPTVQKQPRPLFVGTEGMLNVGKLQPEAPASLTPRDILGTRNTASKALDEANKNAPPAAAATGEVKNIFEYEKQMNARGGAHSPSPEKTFNLFGREVSIPQNMVIPIILGIVLLVVVVMKR